MKHSVFFKNIDKQYQKLTMRLESTDNISHGYRVLALKKALESGAPHPKLPTWKYSNLRNLLDISFSSKVPLITQKTQSKIREIVGNNGSDIIVVLVNGHYSEQFSRMPSTTDIEITSLSILQQSYPNIFHKLMNKSYQASQFFQLVNAALTQDGAYLSIKDEVDVTPTIRVYHFFINENKTPLMLNTQTHITLGNKAKAEILEKSIILGHPSLVNTQTFITCQEDAKLNFCRLSDNPSNNYHFSHLITCQLKNSALKVFDIILGGKYHRNETHYELSAPQAKMDSYTLILPKKSQHYDCVSYLAHVAKNCQSSQLIKSIVENQAHSSFQGIILVKDQAQNTVATMKNDNLFLGNKGRIDAIPQLEIQTDDVQCRHGASISTLDESSLFYLMARGLNVEESKKMLIFSFIEEILALLPHDMKVEIKQNIYQHVQSMLVASMS